MIILLDLNYTLVANSTEKKRPFAMQIQHEKYREWLVSLVAPYHTILMTARPEMHRQATLDSIYLRWGGLRRRRTSTAITNHRMTRNASCWKNWCSRSTGATHNT